MGGLGATYTVHLIHWKAGSGLPIRIKIELFALIVTTEALRAKIKQEQSHGLFATAKRLTLVSELAYATTHFDLPSSPHFVADFLQSKCDFTWKTAVLRF